MARVVWDGVSPLRTGYIDVVGGQVSFPAIRGQSTVASYVNGDNLAHFRATPGLTAALDVVATVKIPIACQVARVLRPGWQDLLVRGFSNRGGRLIAVRVTCEGTNHVLGVPTLFRYRVHYLHDQVGLFVGVAIVLAVLFIFLDPSFSRRLTEVLRGPLSEIGPGSAVAPLMLFVVAGGFITLGFILFARQAGVETTAFVPPQAPAVQIGAGLKGARPEVSVTAGTRPAAAPRPARRGR